MAGTERVEHWDRRRKCCTNRRARIQVRRHGEVPRRLRRLIRPNRNRDRLQPRVLIHDPIHRAIAHHLLAIDRNQTAARTQLEVPCSRQRLHTVLLHDKKSIPSQRHIG